MLPGNGRGGGTAARGHAAHPAHEHGQRLAERDNAEPVGDLGVWHVPQYMPGYPTAATIWPRVVIIQCEGDVCPGYEVTPELGRGEYLFFLPVRK